MKKHYTCLIHNGRQNQMLQAKMKQSLMYFSFLRLRDSRLFGKDRNSNKHSQI